MPMQTISANLATELPDTTLNTTMFEASLKTTQTTDEVLDSLLGKSMKALLPRCMPFFSSSR